jgi:hypothetical protein
MAKLGQGVTLAEYYDVAQDLASVQLLRLTDGKLTVDAGCHLVTRPFDDGSDPGPVI